MATPEQPLPKVPETLPPTPNPAAEIKEKILNAQTREELSGLDTSVCLDLVGEDKKTEGDKLSMKLNFSKVPPRLEWIMGLSHIIPADYSHVRITTTRGEIIDGVRGDQGNFYRADGRYITIWNGYTVTASKEPLPTEEPQIREPQQSPKAEPAPAAGAVAPAPQEQKPEVISRLSESRDAEKVTLIGDSITDPALDKSAGGYARDIPGTKTCAKGGQSTKWMVENFNPTAENAGECAVFLGGVNNIAGAATTLALKAQNGKDVTADIKKYVASIAGDLTTITNKAHAYNMPVVACTMYDWDEKKCAGRVAERLRNKAEKARSAGKKPPELLNEDGERAYAQIAEEMTRQLNEHIRAEYAAGRVEALIDLEKNMPYDDPRYPRSKDGLHPSGKMKKEIAAFVKKAANINEKTSNV
ncbi:hypothetical protein KBD59_04755 [Candidatus Gracilibacteria bacterium]|nr:hypothetical protein [Candidatus Gracilibacteria bacterium]